MKPQIQILVLCLILLALAAVDKATLRNAIKPQLRVLDTSS